MTFNNEGKASRRLPFPLSDSETLDYAEGLTGDIIHTTPSFFPADPDEQIEIVLQMSYNEYTALASAIDVGRDITQGVNAPKLWFTWVRSLIGVPSLNCDDVADCIDTSEAVQQSIVNNNINNGFTPNPDSAPSPQVPTLTTEQTANNIIADITDCSDHATNMAIARAIVRELDETVQDAFESIELATNAAEASGIIVGAVPVVGTGAALIEMADWMLETVVETYTAAYNQSAEDTIACAIYCHIEAECEISLDSLLTIYEDLASITVPAINTIDDLINFVVSTTMNADVTGVALFQYFLLHALKFGGVVFELAGFNDLAYVIKNAAQYSDFSYDQCDDCPPEDEPTDYWKMYLDFRISQWGTVPVVWNGAPNDGSWGGDGYYWNVTTASTTNVSFGFVLDNAYVLKAVATQSVRRGGDGSGSNDIAGNTAWTNANFTGTSANFGQTGINVNTNDVRAGNISAGNVTAFRSINNRSRVQETANLPTTYLRVYSMVIWGIPNAGNVKPAGSVWAGNTLPATISDLFPN